MVKSAFVTTLGDASGVLASDSSTDFLKHIFVNATDPAILVSYLGRLSTLDRFRALTARSTGIVHRSHPPLYATLTTFYIHSPQNPCVCLPAIIAQFPSLRNLRSGTSPEKCGAVRTIIQHIHHLCAGTCCVMAFPSLTACLHERESLTAFRVE